MSEIAKRILKENTPTLLQKIHSYNNSSNNKRKIKSFSEHQRTFSKAKITIKSPLFQTSNDQFNTNNQAEIPFFFRSINVTNTLTNKKKNSLSEMKLMRKNRAFLKGLGISDYHSASTMQKSISSISFSKASRFFSNNPTKNLQLLTSPNDLDDLLPKIDKNKGVSFGFGEKVFRPRYLEKKDLENPAPNKYNVSENLKKLNKGKSFGLPFKVNSKVYFKHIIQPELDVPGPGYYNTEKKTRKNKLGRDLWTKEISGQLSSHHKENSLSLNHSNPNNDILKSGRFKSISFGFAARKL